MIHKVEATIGGRTLTIETGRVAEQAGGAVLAALRRYRRPGNRHRE